MKENWEDRKKTVKKERKLGRMRENWRTKENWGE
jgi:hypothetical protein